MPNVSRIIDRLRAENTVLRGLVVALGGLPPVTPVPAPPLDSRPSPALPTLAHLAQRGL